jgi:hypothetical protein
MENIENPINAEIEEKEENQYFYRRLQTVAKGVSLSVTLPKAYATDLDLKRNSFVKISKDDTRIIIEKAN